MVKVLEIEEGLIDAVRRSQKELINKYSIGFHDERDKEVLKNMFEGKGANNLKGKQAQDISQQLY